MGQKTQARRKGELSNQAFVSCPLDEIRPHHVRFASEYAQLVDSNWPLLGQSALDADWSFQEDNSGIANISANPMVTPIIALIINDTNVHTQGERKVKIAIWLKDVEVLFE